MNLVIDVGNTRVKVALFKRDSVFWKDSFELSRIVQQLKIIKGKFQVTHAIISSVALIAEEDMKVIRSLFPLLILGSETLLPFVNKYGTPETLGVDRLALVAAAFGKYPSRNVLVIDAGTCITYDFIDALGDYHGGAISPGLEMRYKALNQFTENLPLLTVKNEVELIGESTVSSIHSGVINGVLTEVNGIIERYNLKYEKLTIVLTGGDTNFLSERLKNGIFANPIFLLEGLNKILTYNIEND